MKKIGIGCLGVIVILFVLGVIGAALGGNKGTPSNNSTSSNTQTSGVQNTATVQPATVVDATSLIGEYDNNKLSAQDKYTGKAVQTTAYISNISSDITGSYYLALNPSADKAYFGTSMQCFFKDKSVLTSLSNGQQITVKGTMQDMSVGIVEMQDCQIVK